MDPLLVWPLQPSTVIGLGVLTGVVMYAVTGDPVYAGLAAAAVKILVPDSTGAAAPKASSEPD
jgi:hypothetical protein